MQPITMPVHAADDVEPAVKSFARDPNGGLLVLSDVFSVVNRKVIIGSAAQHRLPAIYFFRFFVTDGGLVSYGVDRNEFFAEPPHMLIAYCGVQSRATCRLKPPPSSG